MTAWFEQAPLEQQVSRQMFQEFVAHLGSRTDVMDLTVTSADQMVLQFRKKGAAPSQPPLTVHAKAMVEQRERAFLPQAERLAQIDRFLAAILPRCDVPLDLDQLYPVVRQRDRILEKDSPLAKPLAGDLLAVVMQDQGDSLATLTRDEVGATPVELLWQAALRNLARVVEDIAVMPEAPGYLSLRWMANPVLTSSVLMVPGLMVHWMQAQGWTEAVVSCAARGWVRMADASNPEAVALLKGDMAQDLLGVQPQSDWLYAISLDDPLLRVSDVL